MRPNRLEEISAGYQLQVTTWENDGDNYSTQIISGLTEEDVRFYIDIAKRFQSIGRRGLSDYWGNEEHPTSELADFISSILDKHQNISDKIKEKWSTSLRSSQGEEVDWTDFEGDHDGDLYDYICDEILGYPADEYYRCDYTNFCRVFESFKVFYIPEVAKEVTHKFS